MLTVVNWDDTDKRVAVSQIMRWAGVPEVNCFLDEVAPDPGPRKGSPREPVGRHDPLVVPFNSRGEF